MSENSITLSNLIKKHGWLMGAELGVRRGDFSKSILQDNTNVKLVLVDLWKGSPEHGILDVEGERYSEMESNYFITLQNINPYKERVTIIRKLTTEAAKEIKDESLDFIFIDATHTYNALTNDILSWKNKVKSDGMICGHDYHPFFDNGGMIRGVQEAFGSNYTVDNYTCWFGYRKDLLI